MNNKPKDGLFISFATFFNKSSISKKLKSSFEKSLDRFFSALQGTFKDFKLDINQSIDDTQI